MALSGFKRFAVLLIILLPGTVFTIRKAAGQSDIPSVTDTVFIASLIRQSEKYWYTFPDSSILLAGEAVSKMDTVKFAELFSHACNSLGTAYYMKGFHSICLDYYFKALRIDERMKDSSDIAADLNNIGNIYLVQAKYDKAYEYFSGALKLRYNLNDTRGIGNALLNIANLYISQSDYEPALVHARKALGIFDSLNDKEKLVAIYSTMGTISNNIGISGEALGYYTKALHLAKEINDLQSECILSLNLGNIFSQEGKTGKSILYYEDAVSIAQDIDYLEGLSSAFEKLYLTYEGMKMYEESFQYYKLFVYMRDSLQRKENIEALVKNEMEYKYEKEREMARMEQEKKDLLATEREKQQNLVLIILMILFSGVLVVAFLIYRSYREKKKANSELNQKNKIIEQQNRDITDSIEYAMRIQGAMTNTEYLFTKYHLDYFIVYFPKHIVSGDFYYLTPVPAENGSESKSTYMIATADSTGHGVPGAFMSLIGIMLLDEIIVQKKIMQPDKVLDMMRDEIIKILNPEGRTEKTYDGMDMVLCKFDFERMSLEFAAANNPLYIIRRGEITDYRPDKMPVGLYFGNEKPYTPYSVPLQKGDIIYTITDGYPDQLGGPKGKKLKYSAMKELFVSVHHLTMKEQKKKIEETFRKWKGEYEQTDDICIVGIRV